VWPSQKSALSEAPHRAAQRFSLVFCHVREASKGEENDMPKLNASLIIAMAFVFAVPGTALAGGKDWIEIQDYSHGVHQSISSTRVGSPTTKAPTTTPIGTTGFTAKGTLGGSTGPTKPPLPTTGGRYR
jgi:hypothetical protein